MVRVPLCWISQFCRNNHLSYTTLEKVKRWRKDKEKWERKKKKKRNDKKRGVGGGGRKEKIRIEVWEIKSTKSRTCKKIIKISSSEYYGLWLNEGLVHVHISMDRAVQYSTIEHHIVEIVQYSGMKSIQHSTVQ